MPLINLKMLKGRSVAQKREFVEKVTELAVDVLKTTPADITVIIEEYEKENWAAAGKLYSDK